MTTRTALFALLAVWGVGLGGAMPLRADESVSEDTKSEATSHTTGPASGLINRVWTKADSDGLPGVIRVFLSDGTLISDSCWETHRLSPWKMLSDNALTWNEDGTDISAKIASLSAEKLTLILDLKGGAVEEHYVAAPVPYVCPDMPK